MALTDFSLENQVALVTGGGRGLGRATALGLAEAGASVVLAGRTRDQLTAVAAEIERLGRPSLAVTADVTLPEDQDALVRSALDRFGRIDILVNNAGTTFRTPSESYPETEWDRVMDVNLKGPFLLMQKVGREMIRQGGGRIINVGSLIAVIGMPNIPAYGASKAGIEELTRCLAVEWAKYNIRVNAITPGYFRTDMTAGLDRDPDRGPKIQLRTPMKRWGEPEDLKGVVVFLASKASAYITGVSIPVDGGWLAG
jgi:NAD(P)-dependent dehydrogenase (short-subunit alcohol dehydrogenase family)